MKLLALVKPNSKKGPLVERGEPHWTIFVREPAINQKATEAARQLVAKEFKTSPSRVKLISGAGSRYKRFEINLDN